MAAFEKLEGSRVKLTIEIGAEEFFKATEAAYLKTRGQFNVPGFRKGKAPRKMIENLYGPLVFFDDAFDAVYPDLFEAAIKEHDIITVAQPSISILDYEPGKPVVFAAEVAVKPEVALGAYRGIEVARQEYNVTDEMIDAEIEKEREQIARFVNVERPVADGDQVNLDYSGSVGGLKFDGGTAENQTLVIGSNTFIPGFEAQMVGMAVGEERDLTVTFPEQYHSEELAGKEAVFHVKVNGIEVKELPEADDEFARDVSEFDTIAELREDKRVKLLDQAREDARIQRQNEAVGKAVENATVEIPDALVERQIEHMVNDFGYRLRMQGLSLEDYLKYTGGDMDALRAEMKDEAFKRVKSTLVLEAIGKAEGIAATEEEIAAKIDEYSARFGERAEEFKKNVSADDRQYFADEIETDRILDLIVDSAVEV